MKRFYLYTPQHVKVVVTVDDEDAYRLRSERWKAYKAEDNKLHISRAHNGVQLQLGREILNVTDPNIAVVHCNQDSTDYRRKNLALVPRSAFIVSRSRTVLAHAMKECLNGHKMTPKNAYSYGGRVQCRICMAARAKKNYYRDKAKAEDVAEFMG